MSFLKLTLDEANTNRSSAEYERIEMHYMTKASEVSTNVWVGPTPDPSVNLEECKFVNSMFDLTIHTTDVASIPCQFVLDRISKMLETGSRQLDFPSSGSMLPPSDDTDEINNLVNTIRWMHRLANPASQAHDGHTAGHAHSLGPIQKPRKILIHCTDGYTENSLLTIAYFMYAEGVPAHDAWTMLHRDKGRNFFAYLTDVAFLRSVQKRLLQESPLPESVRLSRQPTPPWFSTMDGSLPSRLLPYLYLGNLNHANNPGLLWILGIRRVLSIGEPFLWDKQEVDRIGEENVMFIGQVEDNGIDSLTQEFDRCLEFIRKFTIYLSNVPPALTRRSLRKGQARRESNACTLPCRRFKICNNMYCRGYGYPWPFFSKSLVSCLTPIKWQLLIDAQLLRPCQKA